LSLLDRTNSVSKESPSSLLPPEARKGTPEESLSRLGPGSLLPDGPKDSGPTSSDVPLMSPSELLPPPAPRVMSRGLVLSLIVAATIVVVVVLGLIVGKSEKSTAEFMHDGVTYFHEGNLESAAIQFSNVLLREPDNVEANLLLGRARAGVGALLDAEKSLRRAIELGTTSIEAVPLLARVLIDLDRHDDALKVLSDFKAPTGSGAQVAILRGRAYLGLGNFVEARTQFTTALDELPADALSGIARIAMMEGDPVSAMKQLTAIEARYPNDVATWLTRADFMRVTAKPQDALQAYQKAQSIQSDNLEAILGAAIVLISQESLVDAKRELRKARALSPSSHLLGYAKAVLAFHEKRYEDCRELLQGVLATSPKHMPSVLLVGHMALAMGDIEQAHDAFVFYLNRFPGHIQARKMHALTLLRKQQPESAVDTLRPFLHLDISDADFFGIAGHALLQIGDLQLAKQVLGRAVKLKPDNPRLLTDLGLAHLSTGGVMEGIAELQKAVAFAPTDVRSASELVFALLARGRLDEATSVAERLRTTVPEAPEPHWLGGMVKLARNDVEGGRGSLEQALKVRPSFLPAAGALARLDVRSGNRASARARFERVLVQTPKNTEAMIALAQLKARDGELSEATALATKAETEAPNAIHVHVALAQLHLQSGRIEDALTAARRARELNPRDPTAVEILARVQAAAGDSAGAVLSYTTLANMRPRSPDVRLALANAHQIVGDRRAAMEVVRHGLSIAPADGRLIKLFASLLIEDKRYDDALSLAAVVRERQPKSGLASIIEGEARIARGEYRVAVAAFRQADAFEPDGLVRLRIHQAETAMLGREADLKPLEDWLVTHPRDVTVRVYIADAMVRSGWAAEAISHYEAALKVLPKDIRILNNLADALLHVKSPRAVDVARQAFDQRPEDPTLALTYGAALVESGRTNEALQILGKFASGPGVTNTALRFFFVQTLVKVGDRSRALAELKILLSSSTPFRERADAQILFDRISLRQ
jgi:putative PEP-CTERM system TPR-repeat lipoprotein